MKSTIIIVLAGIALLAAACGKSAQHSTSPPSASTGTTPAACTFASLPRLTPVGEQSLYGHIEAVTRKGGNFELRFDPAWFLTGSTANRASLEDTGSSDVPNDSYVRDESHRLLTYQVPAAAQVTVLVQATCSKRVTVAQLAKSVPPAGFWIQIRNDTVRSIDQQYHP